MFPGTGAGWSVSVLTDMQNEVATSKLGFGSGHRHVVSYELCSAISGK